MVYKHNNKRIQHRSSSGRFRQSTLADFGIQVVKRPRICNNCGHEWNPIVATGICPNCDAQDSAPVPPTEEELAVLKDYRGMQRAHPDPSTVHQAAKLYQWLNDRGLLE
jgi:hypothetical protein